MLGTAATADNIRRFREVLDRENYTEAGITELLGGIEVPVRKERNLPRLLRTTRRGTAQDTLIRLFLFGQPVPREAVQSALGALPVDVVSDIGVIEQDAGGNVRATLTIIPYRHQLVASDLPRKVWEGASTDFVLGITSSTVSLELSTIRRHSRRTLDLGAGCGLQALTASVHSDVVYATDLNERAVEFTAFNALLNRCDNIKSIAGSGFEPIKGTKFDLIVSNLPFIVSPTKRYTYRDSGLPLDSFVEQMVREAPEHLETGGICQFMCGWVEIEGQKWEDRLQNWLKDSGCDAWVLKIESSPWNRYAESCIRDTEQDDVNVAETLIHEWTDYYEREKIQSFVTGLIMLQKSDRKSHWIAFDEKPGRTMAYIGDAVLLGFALRDYLHEKTDAEILRDKFRPCPQLELLQQSEWEEGKWRTVNAEIGQGSGMRYIGNIDTPFAHLFTLCTGALTLGEAVRELSTVLKAPPEKVIPAAMPLLRNLIGRGFLLPVGLQESLPPTVRPDTDILVV